MLHRLHFAFLIAFAALATGCSSVPEATPMQERATQIALTMVGKPYRYGGNTPAGFDCSGLVQYSFGRAGVRLARSTEQLRRASKKVPSGDLRRGDLLFFDQEGKDSSHVAIYIGSDRFVHAPSSGKLVHVADFTSRYWRTHFNEARRLDLD
jgi:murein DD-endopeptidase